MVVWNELGKKTILQRNAIDTFLYRFDEAVRLEVRQELHLSKDVTVVGHVGRSTDRRTMSSSWRCFINMCRSLIPQHTCCWLVRGNCKKPFKKGTTVPFDRPSTFVGGRPDVNRLLQAMDLFLSPLLWKAFSVSMVEAQCAGLPCVVSDRIPREAALTDQVSFLSLETAPRQWACEIERVRCMASRRTGYYQQIADAGYDIVKNAEWLQNYYLGQWNKTR